MTDAKQTMEQYWVGLDQQGEMLVRELYCSGEYDGPNKVWVEQWFVRNEIACKESPQSEDISVAQSAKDAAWAAAEAAREANGKASKANRIAIAAIVIAVIAVIVSIVTPFAWVGYS
jgi:hypothetical protein